LQQVQRFFEQALEIDPRSIDPKVGGSKSLSRYQQNQIVTMKESDSSKATDSTPASSEQACGNPTTAGG
jgi:hypothetical protein